MKLVDGKAVIERQYNINKNKINVEETPSKRAFKNIINKYVCFPVNSNSKSIKLLDGILLILNSNDLHVSNIYE